MRAAAAGLLGGALLVAGCGGGAGVPATGSHRLAPLSAAIGMTTATRTALLADLHADDLAVAAADSADQTALAGDRGAAAAQMPAVVAGIAAAAAAAARTRAEVTAYANALGQLDAAGTGAPVSAAQRRALVAVVAAGRPEAGALRDAAVAYGAALPTYQAVVADLRGWLAHAEAGFYPTPAVAGGAYQVARTGQADALAAARASIAATNTARQAASAAMDAALTAARTALAPLS